MQSAEKELSNESQYKDRVQDILQKHTQRLLLKANDGDLALIKNQNESERVIIDRVVSNERNAFLCGMTLSGLAFASLRFGPKSLIARMSPEKLRRLEETEAKKGWIQKSVSLIFEAVLSGLVGWRVGYTKMICHSVNSYEEIGKIPLCAGRSIVSDRACPDMINLVHNEIPHAFWENLDGKEESRLQDPQKWQAVRAFAENCMKRRAFEESYRKQYGISPQAAVVVPEGGVPKNVLFFEKK